jgi:small subunit ribosomal protein S17
MEPTKKEKKKKTYIGTVVSDKMDKTIVVKAERTFQDNRFHKIIRKTKKYKVHDEHKQAKKGDTVIFYEGRPLSKMKYMYLEEVVKSDFGNNTDSNEMR